MDFDGRMQELSDAVWSRLSPGGRQQFLMEAYWKLAGGVFAGAGLAGHPISIRLMLTWALERAAVETWGPAAIAGAVERAGGILDADTGRGRP